MSPVGEAKWEKSLMAHCSLMEITQFSVCKFKENCQDHRTIEHTALQKKYLVKMTTSEWLLQFQGSLNRWVI